MIARPNDLDLAFEHANLSSQAGDYEGAISTLEQQLSLTADQGVRRSDRSYRGAEEILGNVRDDTSWGPDCCKRSNLLERSGMNARIKSGHDVKTCLLSER